MNRLVSVAPMLDWTDRHARYFLRILAPHALLYTEMITADALIHGDKERFLKFDPAEHPVALQLGGCDPVKLKIAAKLGFAAGFDEINLNVGCPSDRVQQGRFGAALMLEPQRVAECVAAMNAAVKIPITVKCRIGVDEHDSYEELVNFINVVTQANCNTFIIHARKAWLNGLSPKENRTIPPLCYAVVYQIKREFPHLTIIINGGIKTLNDIEEHLKFIDGVMIGREAYTNPYFLTEIEEKYFGKNRIERHQVIEKLIPYISEELKNNTKLSAMTRHILGLYQGQKGARGWRRHLSEEARRDGSGIEVVQAALEEVYYV